MLKQVLTAKIHRATVTEAVLNYVGSITIDRELMDKSGLVDNEKVLVANLTNGERFETYVIEGERNSGVICLNGGCARKAEVGDLLIIMAFGLLNEQELVDHKPTIIFVDRNNRILDKKNMEKAREEYPY